MTRSVTSQGFTQENGGTYERREHVGGSVLLQLMDPALHRVEGGPAADVVGDHGPVCAAVVALRDGAEALLPGSVPHLHLHTHTHRFSTRGTFTDRCCSSERES